jgi:hypothetical protein
MQLFTSFRRELELYLGGEEEVVGGGGCGVAVWGVGGRGVCGWVGVVGLCGKMSDAILNFVFPPSSLIHNDYKRRT